MKMCNQCFELYEEYFDKCYCPKKKCDGEIVDIDSEIAWPISKINIELDKHGIPARTAFCCSGHLPDDIQPYLGFDFDPYAFEDIKSISAYIKIFIKEIINIPLRALNKKLLECPLITVRDPYIAKMDLLTDKENIEDGDIDHCYPRLFINDLSFKYGKDLHSELDRCYAASYVQKVFKDFLLDCIASIKATPKEMKMY